MNGKSEITIRNKIIDPDNIDLDHIDDYEINVFLIRDVYNNLQTQIEDGENDIYNKYDLRVWGTNYDFEPMWLKVHSVVEIDPNVDETKLFNICNNKNWITITDQMEILREDKEFITLSDINFTSETIDGYKRGVYPNNLYQITSPIKPMNPLCNKSCVKIDTNFCKLSVNSGEVVCNTCEYVIASCDDISFRDEDYYYCEKCDEYICQTCWLENITDNQCIVCHTEYEKFEKYGIKELIEGDMTFADMSFTISTMKNYFNTDYISCCHSMNDGMYILERAGINYRIKTNSNICRISIQPSDWNDISYHSYYSVVEYSPINIYNIINFNIEENETPKDRIYVCNKQDTHTLTGEYDYFNYDVDKLYKIIVDGYINIGFGKLVVNVI